MRACAWRISVRACVADRPAVGTDLLAKVFSQFLSFSCVFFPFLPFSLVVVSFYVVFFRLLVLSVLGGSLLLLLLVHLRFLRAGGTADRLASLQRPRVFAQAARGPAARMCQNLESLDFKSVFVNLQ